MRTLKFSLVLAAAAGVLNAAAASAQLTPQTCAATTPSNAPTCSKTKDATASVGNMLVLKLTQSTIDLKGWKDAADTTQGAADDTTIYAKTFTASNSATGGTDLSSSAASLQPATHEDTVSVMANRAFQLTVQPSTDIFTYSQNGVTSLCRPTGSGAACANPTGSGKSVQDVFIRPSWVTGTGTSSNLQVTTWKQLPTNTANTPIKLTGGAGTDAATAGGYFQTAVKYASAWYYGTDIPGKYTITMVYTVTGQ